MAPERMEEDGPDGDLLTVGVFLEDVSAGMGEVAIFAAARGWSQAVIVEVYTLSVLSMTLVRFA